MTSPFKNAAKAPVVDLDSAEAYDPDLETEESVKFKVTKTEVYDGGYGPACSVFAEVLDAENPMNEVGSVRRLKFTGLGKSAMEGGNGARKRFRGFLAACLNLSPSQAQPSDDFTWNDIFAAMNEDEEALFKIRAHMGLSGDLVLYGSGKMVPSKAGRSYPSWTFAPAEG